MSRPRAWDSLSLWEQITQNLGAFAARHRMEADAAWPETRVRATVAALDRLRAYAREREERFAAYECGQSSENYRRRWHSGGKVVDVDFVVGGRR